MRHTLTCCFLKQSSFVHSLWRWRNTKNVLSVIQMPRTGIASVTAVTLNLIHVTVLELNAFGTHLMCLLQYSYTFFIGANHWFFKTEIGAIVVWVHSMLLKINTTAFLHCLFRTTHFHFLTTDTRCMTVMKQTEFYQTTSCPHCLIWKH